MTLVDSALHWAEAGVPVFPVNKSKAPLTANGFKDGSTDPDTIRSMFSRSGAWGIGGAMGREAGLFAIDSDHYKPGAAGLAAKAFIADLERAGLLPETRTHTTVSGGRHYLFSSEAEWPNVNPSDGIEVKGEGGYIVLPPSPGYAVEREGISPAPRGLIKLLLDAKRETSNTPSNALKQKILSGDDFHDSLTLLAARRAAEGVKPEVVQGELLQILNASVAASESHPRHSRWLSLTNDKTKELSRIVFSAEQKFNPDTASETLREAAGGKFGTPQPAKLEMFAPKKPKVFDADAWPFENERGYFGHTQLDDVLEQNFVAYPILVEGETTLISAEPKAGKTLVSQTLAMHIAAGFDLGSIQIYERRPVLYFALESQIAIKKRLLAWRKAHDPENTILTDATFPFYVSEMPMNLLEKASRQELAARIAAADKWFQKEGAAPLGAIVIDTLTKAMPGGDQNSVEDTSAVFDVIQEIRQLGVKSPVVFIHHNKKDGGSPRGSGNIQAEPDTLLTLTKNADTAQLHLKVYMARSIEDDHDFIFDIKSVNLGKTSQGFDIDAPILTPALVEKNAVDSVVDELKLEVAYQTMFKELITLGLGTHPIKKVHAELRKTMPDTLYGRAKTLWAASPEYLDFFTTIVPTTGRTFEGHNIVPMLKTDRRTGVKLEAVHIRKLAGNA